MEERHRRDILQFHTLVELKTVVSLIHKHCLDRGGHVRGVQIGIGNDHTVLGDRCEVVVRHRLAYDDGGKQSERIR